MQSQYVLLEERIRAKWDMDLSPQNASLRSIPSIPPKILIQGMKEPLCSISFPPTRSNNIPAKKLCKNSMSGWVIFAVVLLITTLIIGFVWWLWKRKREIILDSIHKLKRE